MTHGQIPPPDDEGQPAPLAAGVERERTTPDPRSVTGAYYVVTGRYGKRKPKQPKEPGQPFRPGDKPLWWVAFYHFAKALLGVLPILAYLATIALAKHCGVEIPKGIAP